MAPAVIMSGRREMSRVGRTAEATPPQDEEE